MVLFATVTVARSSRAEHLLSLPTICILDLGSGVHDGDGRRAACTQTLTMCTNRHNRAPFFVKPFWTRRPYRLSVRRHASLPPPSCLCHPTPSCAISVAAALTLPYTPGLGISLFRPAVPVHRAIVDFLPLLSAPSPALAARSMLSTRLSSWTFKNFCRVRLNGFTGMYTYPIPYGGAVVCSFPTSWATWLITTR